MKFKRAVSCVFILAGLVACQSGDDTSRKQVDILPKSTETRVKRAANEDVAQYVDPMIGTSNFGATHPGAQYPHAMASVAPFNVAYGKEEGNVFEKDEAWNSRVYIAENKFLTGFSHANLSGVGCPELGVILSMPQSGELELDAKTYGTTYKNEVAMPGYYSVELDKGKIKTEVTATLRTGRSRFHFPPGLNHIILNIGLGLTNETGGAVKIVSDQEVEGHRTVGTFCYNPEDTRQIYFVARVSKNADQFGTFKKAPKFYGVEGEWIGYNDAYKPYPANSQPMAGDNVGAYFSFQSDEAQAIELQVGISYVSTQNARENLEAEQNGQKFEHLKDAAYQAWDSLLGRVSVSGDRDDKVLFYTALYHVLIHPNIIQDVNGDYPLMGGQGVGNIQGRNRYTVFSLWDTYRNVHPLLSLIYPEIQSDMVSTMVSMAEENGWIPKWELLSMETGVMVGDPGLPVITDTYRRGIQDFDIEAAFKAMERNASVGDEDGAIRPYLNDYLKLGYIPFESETQWGGTVSSSLEYYIADWNLGQLALDLGHKNKAETYLTRAQGYKHYFDQQTGMLRPKLRDGSFLDPFNPEAGKNFEAVPGFVEGTAWNYRFYVPHDIPGLIDLLGGETQFVEQLDTLFETDNFDMANEPDISYPYLYNYVPGQEWKSTQRTHALIRAHYSTAPGGIPGNDDAGTLSAWLAFSMMGLYPVLPGDMDYAAIAPMFDEVRISLNPEYYPGDMLILRRNNPAQNHRLVGLTFNSEQLPGFFVDHRELVKGGTLEFNMLSAAK